LWAAQLLPFASGLEPCTSFCGPLIIVAKPEAMDIGCYCLVSRGISGRHREIESGLAGPFEDEHDDDLVAATPR
jgi:hypothetical protein